MAVKTKPLFPILARLDLHWPHFRGGAIKRDLRFAFRQADHLHRQLIGRVVDVAQRRGVRRVVVRVHRPVEIAPLHSARGRTGQLCRDRIVERLFRFDFEARLAF